MALWAAVFLFVAPALAAEASSAFLEEAFPEGMPAPEALWLTPDIRAAVKERLGEAMTGLRIRYWRAGERTAWILDEIGKEEPITAGIVIDGGRIAAIDVLVYRESRGGEVRLPYFRRQFIDAALTEGGDLSENIDGISGATLSVRAMMAMARRALLLHEIVTEEDRK